MPKKMGVNSKAEDAKARKAAAEAEKKAQEAKQKEDQYWREAEGSKSRSAKKREEEEQKRAEAAAKKAEARRLAEQEEQEIEKNREGDLIEAHTVEEALAQISVADTLPAFEEAELPRLKADKPGLTHTQYKEMIWKLWKKSPDNPLNR
uniref:Coiled-coil domain-containing protein n=1 Tax=Chenopodium quinoa TaxID=63459 RepID=A0A803LG78_CHEQI